MKKWMTNMVKVQYRLKEKDNLKYGLKRENIRKADRNNLHSQKHNLSEKHSGSLNYCFEFIKFPWVELIYRRLQSELYSTRQ